MLTPTCLDCTRTSTSRTSSGPGRVRWEDGSKFLKTTPLEWFFWKKIWANLGGGEWTWRGGGGGGRRSWWHVQPWRRQKISFELHLSCQFTISLSFQLSWSPKQAARSSPPPDQGSSPPASTSPGCPPSTQLWSVSLKVIWRESQKLNQIDDLHTAHSTVSETQEWKEILKVQPTPVYISLSPGGQATRLPEGSGGWVLSTSKIKDMKL